MPLICIVSVHIILVVVVNGSLCCEGSVVVVSYRGHHREWNLRHQASSS